MLPQPPPSAPAPPPSEAAVRSRRWRSRIVGWGVASFLGVGALALIAPLFLHAAPKSPVTQAVNNARQIGLSLADFQSRFDSFPDAGTATTVVTQTGTSLSLGTRTSNDYFRQLFALNPLLAEGIFYCKTEGAKMPDAVVLPGEPLKKGECGFSYILGADSSSEAERPVVVAPLIPGTLKFDPRPFEGKALVLMANHSVKMLKINEAGEAMLDGVSLFDPSNRVWEGSPPVVVWPE